MRKIARRRLDVLPRRLCCVVAVFQVKASSLIGRERCHLQSMGTQVPPRATPQQTSCWDLLPSPPLATIHGGRIQTEELIAFPAPLTSSSACPVLTAPSPLNNTTIIYPLIIGHSTPAPSCIVFVSVKIANFSCLQSNLQICRRLPYRTPCILNDNARWHCLLAAKNK